MQTIKNINYEVERVGDKTFCTIKGDLSYLVQLLAGANTQVEVSNSFIDVHIQFSLEQQIFIKNLANLGMSTTNDIVTVVTNVKLKEGDIDDQNLANRLARDKAYKILCREVKHALSEASKPIYRKLFDLQEIGSRLDELARNNDLIEQVNS